MASLFNNLLFTLFFFLAITMPPATFACGWWGDGEMSKHWETDTSPTFGLDAAKLPGRMGYGLAIPEPGRATPYLNATGGRPLNRIQDLAAFGFKSVIDLGTPTKTAALHRAETEAVGMRYFNIPVVSGMPNRKQMDRFGQLVLSAMDGPLLVYAPTQGLLGTMWASYRIGKLGAPFAFSINEGRSLGMTPTQTNVLRQMFNGRR
jgi:protein tyrosine phosphatase (PTP) superfamily phosphohydrolase (DUF442 family)